MKMNRLPVQKNKPKQTQFKPCPERSEFTLSVIEGNGPISKQLQGGPMLAIAFDYSGSPGIICLI